MANATFGYAVTVEGHGSHQPVCQRILKGRYPSCCRGTWGKRRRGSTGLALRFAIARSDFREKGLVGSECCEDVEVLFYSTGQASIDPDAAVLGGEAMMEGEND
ncbi:MAG: hypothetical protein HKL84_10280 [Acidimicrobiaceae bacterium]|nr:hypothetical protein [Acidimicrobiaceae bacterium]